MFVGEGSQYMDNLLNCLPLPNPIESYPEKSYKLYLTTVRGKGGRIFSLVPVFSW